LNLKKYFKNKYHVLIVTTLLAFSYVQPAGIQFKFCFGDDGHFDVSVDSDWKNQGSPVDKGQESIPDDHHGDCQDVILASNDMVSCRLNSDLFFSNQTMSWYHDLPVLVVNSILPEKSVNNSYYSGFLSEQCNCFSAFLTSIILLI
jgi:hypothetical protein